jgi:hypothetical protein
MKKILLITVGALLLSACTADLPAITGCEPVGDIRPVCGMQSPEDIAALADGRHLLLAHFGGLEGTGSISLFDTQSEKLTPLFPLQSGLPGSEGADWGEDDCPAPDPEQFSPHGTHLGQLADGRWRYLVVNHGGRDSIEMFELTMAGEGSYLEWRGCVLAAEERVTNDVVGLSDGDLVYSRMYQTGSQVEQLLNVVGFGTGDLYRWSKQTGSVLMPGTGASQPNGLEISADEQFIFANMYLEKEIWKIDLDSGETVAVGQVASADNSAWGTDGRLWIATHSGGLGEILSCFESQTRPCAASFEIVAMDPETMETEVVFAHGAPPMGAATVAVPQGDRVYMGSFVGDRLISVQNFNLPIL